MEVLGNHVRIAGNFVLKGFGRVTTGISVDRDSDREELREGCVTAAFQLILLSRLHRSFLARALQSPG